MDQMTAVLLYTDALSAEIEAGLAALPSVQRIRADAAVCTAFQVVRIPTLAIYNTSKEETARAFGDLGILELVRQVLSSDAC